MNDNKVGFLDILILLAKGKKFIFFFTLIACIIAVAYALLATERWMSETTVTPIASQGAMSMASGLLDGLGLGFGSNVNLRALNLKNSAVLKSRTVTENTVRKFDLVNYFNIAEPDTIKAMEIAISRFHNELLDILLNVETNFMTIRITTRDRLFSQQIAQHLLDTLVEYTQDNANSVGRQKRELLERRVNQITKEMLELLDVLKHYQITHNIVEIERQALALITNHSRILEELFLLDLELNLIEQTLPNSPSLAGMQARRVAIVETLRGFEHANNDTPFMLPLRDANVHSFTIQEKVFNLEIYKKILETLHPQLELARLEEIDNLDRVEIIDLPNLAGQRAFPRRALICVLTFLVSFLFSSGCVLMVNLVSDEDKLKLRELWKSLFR